MSGLPPAVQARIHRHLDAIASEFIAGAKITLLVRPPLPPGEDGDCLITNDTIAEAIAGLERRSLAAATGEQR